MIKSNIILGLISLLAFVQPAFGETKSFYDTGNSFLAKCKNKETMSRDCITYIVGLDHGFQAAKQGLYIITDTDLNSMTTAGPFFCPPSNVTIGQILDVLLKELENNPAERHLPLTLLAHGAWIKAWPCQYRSPFINANSCPTIKEGSPTASTQPDHKEDVCFGSFCLYRKH